MTESQQKSAITIFTIGHSNRSIEEFIEILESFGISMVVDVRSIPRSGHNPQFGGKALSKALEAVGTGYVHLPGLGGFRHPKPDSVNTGWRNLSFRGYADYMQTEEFQDSLQKVIDLAKDHRVALMCAEAVPWQCHRSLIADSLVARGIQVEDIYSKTNAKPHSLPAWAKVSGTHVTYPAPTPEESHGSNQNHSADKSAA